VYLEQNIDKAINIALRLNDGTTAYALQHRFRDIKKQVTEMNAGQALSYHFQVFPSFAQHISFSTQHITYWLECTH
jgi:hypothetical protein